MPTDYLTLNHFSYVEQNALPVSDFTWAMFESILGQKLINVESSDFGFKDL